MLHALIFEGSFLLKHVIYPSKTNNSIRGKTLETLLKLNKKIDDLMKNSSGANKAKKTKKNENLEYDEYVSDDIEDESGAYENDYDDEDDD